MAIRLKRTLGVGLAIATAVVPAACSSSDAGTGKSTAQTLTIGWAQNPTTLNPATNSQGSAAAIMMGVFDTLVWLGPDAKLVPGLAKSWTVSPDGKTYDFTLREDVKFHDSTKFDAASVVANVAYITDKSTQSTIAVDSLGPCTKVTATSAYVVRFSCTTSYAPLLTLLSSAQLGIQSPAAIETYGKDLGDHLVGTGPFKFVSFAPNDSVVLERNPDYNWAPEGAGLSGPPKLDKVVFKIISDDQARINALQSGQVQLINKVPGTYFNNLKARYEQLTLPTAGQGQFSVLNTDRFPTDDVAVRQAILYSVDRSAVVKLADAGAFPVSNTPLVKGTAGYDTSLESSYPYDPAKAAQLLTSAGWTKSGDGWQKDGKKLSVSIAAFADADVYVRLSEAIQAGLEQNGFDAHVSRLGRGAYLDAGAKGLYNIVPTSNTAVDPDMLSSWFTPQGLFNWSRFNSPQLDQLLRQGREISDLATRTKLYGQAQKIIMDQALILPERPDSDLALMDKRLKGVSNASGGSLYYYATTIG
ncbi:ABC transporter substrate-binding protein [Kribbella sp. NPDC050124]|uniref:ABC transporter substrate-binding protein n=1 Tax=Kribbella sp. NPDC050124 TaxID=3364114 RepID=UPI0037B3F10D